MNLFWRLLWPTLVVLLILYGIHGVIVDDLYIPGKHGPGVDLHGISAWIGLLSIFVLIAMARIGKGSGRSGRSPTKRMREIWLGLLFIVLMVVAVILNEKS